LFWSLDFNHNHYFQSEKLLVLVINNKKMVFFFATGSNNLTLSGEENGSSSRCRMSTNCCGPGADWTSKASSFSHIFIPSSSGETCYYSDCKGSGKIQKHLLCQLRNIFHVLSKFQVPE